MTVNEAIEALSGMRDDGLGDFQLRLEDGGDVLWLAESGLSCTVYVQGRAGDLLPAHDVDAQRVLRVYGVNPDGMAPEAMEERLRGEAHCEDVGVVIRAVMGFGSDAGVRLPYYGSV
jgi:hypothetical protein